MSRLLNIILTQKTAGCWQINAFRRN